jgi:hypothetical protein
LGQLRIPKCPSLEITGMRKTVERIAELLCEYSDMFPTTFTEMKGIAGELGEMKIPLRA